MKANTIYFIPAHNTIVVGTGRRGTFYGDLYWFEFDNDDEWMLRIDSVVEIGKL